MLLTHSVAVQVYTAEEKAALAMMHAEEAAKKEAQLVADMKALVDASIGNADASPER
jgi:hypothetical protein